MDTFLFSLCVHLTLDVKQRSVDCSHSGLPTPSYVDNGRPDGRLVVPGPLQQLLAPLQVTQGGLSPCAPGSLGQLTDVGAGVTSGPFIFTAVEPWPWPPWQVDVVVPHLAAAAAEVAVTLLVDRGRTPQASSQPPWTPWRSSVCCTHPQEGGCRHCWLQPASVIRPLPGT